MLVEAGCWLRRKCLMWMVPALALQPSAAPCAFGGAGIRAGLTGLRRRSAAPNWLSARARRT
jgi:hypothetical protein